MTLDPKLTETHILALTLYGECLDDPLDSMIALGCLVRNRVLAGEAYQGVCLGYPCWQDENRRYTRLQNEIEVILNGGELDPRYLEAAWIATGMIRGYCRDVLKGATKSHPVTELPRPDWAQPLIPIMNYARHVFYGDAVAQ